MSEQFECVGISLASMFENKEILSSKHMSIESKTAETTARFFIFFIPGTKLSKIIN
jgi:hypothetical protein